MAETPNYKLYLTPEDDTTTRLLDWVQKFLGPSADSNMMQLDAIIAALEAAKANKVVESAEEPTGLSSGDEWDRLL
ncbi:MAG: hypothetical protein ACI3XJ_12690 [Oscillospiraceae bacterium]